MAKKTVVSRELYQPIIRLAVGLIILVIINVILRAIPMLNRLVVPGVFISAGAIVSVVIGIIMISLFITFRRDFAPRLQAAFPNFPESGIIVSSAVNLGMIIVAYSMFDGLIVPFMRGFSWVYSLVFLLIAIPSLYKLVMTLYRSSGRITDLIGGKVAEATGELIKCSNCGGTVKSGAKFCPKCGTTLATPAEPVAKETMIKCSKCSVENKSTDKFCSNCGEILQETP